MEYLNDFLQYPGLMGVVSTLVLLTVVLVVRSMAARAIRRNEGLAKDIRRRWLVQVRNAALIVLLIGLVMIWAEELRLFAVSILAVAVATAIATKELIQCLTGSALKVAGRSFKIGDRIEIASVRGDVIDHNAMTTTVLEIGPSQGVQQLTGRAVVLPNSVFLGKPLSNESFTHDFVLHSFIVPVKLDDDWMLAEQDLLEAARQECSPFVEEARSHFSRFAKREGLESLAVDPRVAVLIPKAGELELLVRIAVPARRKGRIEQAILRRFLTLAAARAADTAPKESSGQETVVQEQTSEEGQQQGA